MEGPTKRGRWGREGEGGLEEGGEGEVVRGDLGMFHEGVGVEGLEGVVVVGESSDEGVADGD